MTTSRQATDFPRDVIDVPGKGGGSDPGALAFREAPALRRGRPWPRLRNTADHRAVLLPAGYHRPPADGSRRTALHASDEADAGDR